jgi:hypothetical protein
VPRDEAAFERQLRRGHLLIPLPAGEPVKADGNQRYTRIVATQAEALATARRIARNQGVDVVIHGRDGGICEKDSYGSDPFPPRDLKH